MGRFINNSGNFLPWDMATHNPSAGFLIATTIKKSKLKGVNLGRFSLHDIPSGTCISSRYFIDSSSVDILKPNNIILINSTQSLNNLIDKWHHTYQTPQSFIREKCADFLHTIKGTNQLSLASVSNFFNHSTPNIVAVYMPGALEIFYHSIRDIKADEELYIDYTKYKFPNFYLQWCKQHGLLTNQQQIAQQS